MNALDAYADREAERKAHDLYELMRARNSRKSGARYSVVRAVTACHGGGLRDGLEAEFNQEAARQIGLAPDISKVWIPWGALAERVLIAGTAAQGGNLVPRPATPAVQALQPYMTVMRLGAQVYENLAGDVAIPRFGTNAAASWPGETGTATASDPGVRAIRGAAEEN